MANSNSNRKVVPAAAEALNKFKYEVASDMCVKNIFKSAVRTNVSKLRMTYATSKCDVVYIFLHIY